MDRARCYRCRQHESNDVHWCIGLAFDPDGNPVKCGCWCGGQNPDPDRRGRRRHAVPSDPAG